MLVTGRKIWYNSRVNNVICGEHMVMEIINGTIDHLEDVYKLICELENGNLEKDNFTRIYQDNINNKDIYYFLAIKELKIIGFASFHIQKLLHHCAKIGEIQEIIILEDEQSSGVGTALFNRIKEVAVQNECVQLEVCCNLAREKSHQFYIKQGIKRSHYKFTYRL